MGTHPIFESDFDCLTEKKSVLKNRPMADVSPSRKRLMEGDPLAPKKEISDSPERNPAGNVLLLTILDALYPINTKLLERICSYAGPVLRIVIFRKKSVQAMVEFDSVLGAQRAKAALNGADIYRGCCTIKVEYAKPTSLNVFKNDDNTRDFSEELRHHEGKFRNPESPDIEGRIRDYDEGATFDKYGFPIEPFRDREAIERAFRDYGLPPPVLEKSTSRQRSVRHDNRLMIYDLPSVINCDRIFNLMCLYGNVQRVKFFEKPSYSALVEYETPQQIDSAVEFLESIRIFGSKVKIERTNVDFDHGRDFSLRDGSSNFSDFSQNRNNRFLTSEAASKNRLSKPVKNLHFYNAPSSITLDELAQISCSFHIMPPVKIRTFKKIQDKVAGLLEYQNVADSVAALCCLNHFVMKSSKNNP